MLKFSLSMECAMAFHSVSLGLTVGVGLMLRQGVPICTTGPKVG